MKNQKLCSGREICWNEGCCIYKDGLCIYKDELIITEDKKLICKTPSLIFVSRHDPNDGQIALATQRLGFAGITKKEVIFSEDPVKDLKEAGIEETEIALVAPSHITNILLNAGYTLIEFVNSPVKREKMVFCCVGAYRMFLNRLNFDDLVNYGVVGADQPPTNTDGIYSGIIQEYIPAPLSIEEQYESAIN